jgi:pimeloyl-ACP methyl ester carboxylesterase
MSETALVVLRHNKVHLALHPLRSAATAGSDRPPLLLLHGLGEQTPAEVPAGAAGWPGPIWGLDFTGHGASTIPRGGGYTCELLMADADIALAHLGGATLFGRGLGGYVAVLVAGARPALVRGAVVADGPGLDGGEPPTAGPPRADLTRIGGTVGDGAARPPDAYALQELASDVRSPEYAAGYAREATDGSGLDPAIVVCCRARPPWLVAVLDVAGVEPADPLDASAALQAFA